MRPCGFSTGALARGNVALALAHLAPSRADAIEISALRVGELDDVLRTLAEADLARYRFCSFHAPSAFTEEQEAFVADRLADELPPNIPVVLHPDAIRDPALWRRFGNRLLLENMDLRKNTGRSVEELQPFFDILPDAGFCFDIGHAYQFDPTMHEAIKLLVRFEGRIRQLHVSRVGLRGEHVALTYPAMVAFHRISPYIPRDVPAIIESCVAPQDIETEIRNALVSLNGFRENEVVDRELETALAACA